ncbi:MAG TPA: CHAT domain-containing tetratricopeptide repeat protein, partial [Hyphomicrobiaceae bacterium]|nr:CHAT domain-containing tetratricopeptide repeat protein [Hyphomicrobiaceae bacterium]
GSEHPLVATRLNNLALLLEHTNRVSEAEPLMRRALTVDEKSHGPDHSDVARDLNNLAQLLRTANRLAEAEPLMRRALDIDEKAFGPKHPNVAIDLNNLAGVLKATNRLTEAEALYRRALAINEESFGAEHPSVAITMSNLGDVLKATHRLAEAEAFYRRSLLINEKSYGSEHPHVAVALNNLALALLAADRFAEAEPLFRRALTINEANYGPDHPNVAKGLDNLGLLLNATNRRAEAEPLFRRALTILVRSFGPEHPDVAVSLSNLAILRAELGDWAEAAGLHRRAKPIMTAGNRREGADSGLTKAVLADNTWALRGSARAVFHADPETLAAREEAFELAQWALQTGAADALAQMSVRFAKGTGPLAVLVRERQDLVARRQGETLRLDVAAGRADAKAAEEARTAIAALDVKLAAIDARLSAEFKDYAELANPKPLTIAATQALLTPTEALVVFLDVRRVGSLAEETLTWVVTKKAVRWRSISLGTDALSESVAALRCGLDASSWNNPANWPQESAVDKQRIAEQQARRARCKELLGRDVSTTDGPPFDLSKSHELYQALLEPFADLTNGKHLIIVPSGPLTRLPFHVLVTRPVDPSLTGMARYQKAAWLVLQQPVTVLPSVGSLQALRRLPPSQAHEPYIAFGNPLLLGAAGNDRSAWGKQRCAQPAGIRAAEGRASARRGVSLRAVDLAELRAQEPLPETADELCAVAEALGAAARESDTIWLGERATERNLKRLSREGKLARYRVVHFATHGLLSGESEAILKAKAEPALILTPPEEGTPASELEEDDGLLTASEVAQLELDADWVVLSACNTAAGEKGDAEALSGLARAFFYAKARVLLVSHWPVNSDAAVKLTTRTFEALKSNPSIGRSEALRRSMVELITGDRPQDGERASELRGFEPRSLGKPQDAHPATWAPFVLVGEGAR